MKLRDCMEDYFQFIQHEQRVEKSTLETYKSWLRFFMRWLEANGYTDPDVEVFSTIVLRRFMYYLSGEKHYRPRTIRGVFYPIKGLARHLLDNGAIPDNPCTILKMPKKDAAQRTIVTSDQVTQLLSGCDRLYRPRQIALTRAILSVLVYGGLRRSELMSLCVNDYVPQEKAILIRAGKGNKSRKVFVCETCVRALNEWLAVREKDTTTDYLFTFDRSRRVHERGLRTVMEQVKAAAGMGECTDLTPHVLRHFYASHLMEMSAPLSSIQHALGHSSIAVTAQYLHINEQNLRDIAALSELPQPSPIPVSAVPPVPVSPAPPPTAVEPTRPVATEASRSRRISARHRRS